MSIVAPDALTRQQRRRNTRFRDHFLEHFVVDWLVMAESKSAPARSQRIDRVGLNEFFTPPQNVGYALFVDVDRPDAVLEIYDRIPAEIAPSWVTVTPNGAQAGWFIDPVNTNDKTGRSHPIRYARNIGKCLRTILNGDKSVDPLTPSRVRNPAYEQADTLASPTPPVYNFTTLKAALQAAGLWDSTPIIRSGKAFVAPPNGPLCKGERNQGIFDASRHVAYVGGDYVAEAWAANERCETPLGIAEVNGIIRSITRYMTEQSSKAGGYTPINDGVRQALSEMGRRGGLANTPAQQAARAKGPAAAAAARKHRATNQARKAQQLRRKGYSRHKIAATLGKHPSTVSRYLQRWIPLSTKELLACITGASGVGGPSRLLHHSPYRSVRPLRQCPLQANRPTGSESPPTSRCRTLRNPLTGTWLRSILLFRRRQ